MVDFFITLIQPNRDYPDRNPQLSSRISEIIIIPMKKSFCLLCGFVVLFFMGCQTLDKRIAEHRELWNSFSTEEQERVRSGQLWEGMTQDAVWLAWGAPRYRRHGAEGKIEFEEWIYTRLQTREVMDWRYRPVYQGRDYVLQPEFGPVQVYDEVPSDTVRFINGKVVAWSRLSR